MGKTGRSVKESLAKYGAKKTRLLVSFGKKFKEDQRGQGTVEYAILVGVLVVIAIIAVVAFKDNLQQLWESISEGVNSL